MLQLVRVLLVCGLLWAQPTPIAAAQLPDAPASGIIVRTSLDPSNEAVIGQRIRLWIDVLFPGEMPFPPRLEPPGIPGAQVFRFETQGITLRERIGGTDYVGKRFEFAVYARRGGELAIPPTTIALLDLAGDDTASATSPPARLKIVIPAGIDPSQPVVAAPRFTMTERWSPEASSEFKVGDALQRTITRRSDDVPGSALGDLDFTVADGVRVYREPPEISDRVDRGEVTGERIDRVTYVFEAAGRYTIAGLTQKWWDLTDANVHSLSVRGRTLGVIAVAPRSGDGASHGGFVVVPRPWVFVIAWLPVVIGLWLAWPRLLRGWRSWERRRADSEPAAFRKLEHACVTGDAGQTYRALTTWRLRLAAVAGAEHLPPQLSGLEPSLASLERSLFEGTASSAGWTGSDGRLLARALERSRRRMSHRRHRHRLHSSLPPLNPTDQEQFGHC